MRAPSSKQSGRERRSARRCGVDADVRVCVTSARRRSRAAENLTTTKSTTNDANAWWHLFISVVGSYVAALGGLGVISEDEFALAARAAFSKVNSTIAGRRGCPRGIVGDSKKTLKNINTVLRLNRKSAGKRPGVSKRVPQCDDALKFPSDVGSGRVQGVAKTLQELYETIFVLDLGTGTSPWSDFVEFGDLGDVWIFITVDNEPKRRATFQRDVREWPQWIDDVLKYMKCKYPNFKRFHWVHWSPECTQLSASNTTGARDIDGAVFLALAGLSLIARLSPTVWTMESSASGAFCLEKQAPIMGAFDQFRVDEKVHFCQALGLGNWKPGRWWTNANCTYLFPLRVLQCSGWSKCPYCTTFGGHRLTSQGGRSVTGALGMKRDDCMRFPPALVNAWMRIVATFLKAHKVFRV